jgi:DNA-binding phage protein
MAFEKVLRELIKKGGLRMVARELDIDHSSLFKSIQDGSNIGLNRIEGILNLFGLELKAVKRKGVKPSKPRSKKG